MLGRSTLRVLRRTLRSSHNCHSRWVESDAAVRSRVAAHDQTTAPAGRGNVDHGHSSRPFAMFCCCEALSRAVGRSGLDVPSRRSFADTPPVLEPEADPTEPKRGWQHRAARCLEERHLRRQVWPTLTDPTRAFLRSQQGPLASAALTALPTSRATRIDPQPVCGCAGASFSRSIVLSHLLMWPPTRHVWRHRAACSRAVVLCCRGFPVEWAEAGGRVGLDGLSPHSMDALSLSGHPCMATARHDGTQPPRAVWHCRQLAGRRNHIPRTLR